MTTQPLLSVSQRRRVPLVWIVPLVALGIVVWMFVREWRSRGPEITIEFANGSGIEAGKTVLEHKGVSVGTVRSVELDNNLSGVRLQVRLEKNAAALARNGTQFWIVHPEIGFAGVRGLDTLVTGVRLNARPGNGPPAAFFRGLDEPPAPENSDKGRAFILWSDHLGSVQPQTPVSYRDVKVGEVETSRLSDDAAGVVIRIRIHSPYGHLVRTNTQFWNAGGMPLKISLFGAEVRNLSLSSLLTGAIAFATPDQLEAVAAEGAQFKLNGEPDKEWLKWHPKIPIEPTEESPENAPNRNGLPAKLKRG